MNFHLFAGFVLSSYLLPVTIRINMWSLFHVVYRYMYLGTLLSIIIYYVYSPGVGNLQGVQWFQGFTEHLVPQHWWGVFCQVGHTREQREVTHTSGKTSLFQTRVWKGNFKTYMQKQISVFKKHIYFWLWSSIWDEIKMDFTMKFLYFLKLQFNLYWGENWENFIKIIANNSFHNNSLNVICSWLIYLHVQMLHETWFIINKLWNEILACKEKLFYSMLYLLVHKVNLCHFSLRKKSAAP